jgi:hypothetical protein
MSMCGDYKDGWITARHNWNVKFKWRELRRERDQLALELRAVKRRCESQVNQITNLGKYNQDLFTENESLLNKSQEILGRNREPRRKT